MQAPQHLGDRFILLRHADTERKDALNKDSDDNDDDDDDDHDPNTQCKIVRTNF